MTCIVNRTTGAVLASNAEIAHGPWASFLGLMGRRELPSGGALVLPRTRSVHSHFMRFPIDVVFHDRDGTVVGIEHALRPWRFSAYHRRASGAIEMPAGLLKRSGTQPGHTVAVDDAS
jgi:uncharacterized membrane protein (UPF0127 family)